MLQGQPWPSNYDTAASRVDDATLVVGLQRGDECSLEHVLQHFGPALYRLAYYQLQNTELAEDLVAEVMVRVIGRIGAFRLGEGSFKSWLFRIARNLLADHFRQRRRRPQVSLEEWLEANPASEPSKWDPQIDLLVERQQIEAGLATLTDEQREVIVLHVIEGWELPQVAELLDRSVTSIKGLYYRGVRSLRRVLLRDLEAAGELFLDSVDSSIRLAEND